MSGRGIDADAVIAAQLEYLRAGGESNPRRRKYEKKLSAAIASLSRAESDMRRAFNRWDGYRQLCQSIERKLDALDKEQNHDAGT